MTIWRYAASSDVGLVRELNEDAIHVDETLAVVADGMGGHAAGEIASAIAVEVIRRTFALNPTSDGLLGAVLEANQSILADAQTHPERFGMGTTAVVIGLVNTDGGLAPVIVNVGDSRAYQLRDGALRQITVDHSVAEEWVRQGRLTPEEAAVHPRRHQLTRTLGVEVSVTPDVVNVSVREGDRILLCSDGLSNELTDDEIADAASSPVSLDEAVRNLVDRANRHGGRDNVSAVLVEFVAPVASVPAGTLSVFATGVVPAATAVGTRDEVAPVAHSAPRRRRARRPRPRLTWRLVLFVLILCGLVASVYEVLGWYERSNYYLAARNGEVVVFRGQPGGLLWFKPTFASETGVKMSQLLAPAQASINATMPEPSLSSALSEAARLHSYWSSSQPTTTTTSTTVTTVVKVG